MRLMPSMRREPLIRQNFLRQPRCHKIFSFYYLQNKFVTYIVRMTSYHDPDTRHILNARKVERDAEWCHKQIGDAAYLRSLMILGYGDKDAQTELNLLKLLRR
jgi:hypothetical protein